MRKKTATIVVFYAFFIASTLKGQGKWETNIFIGGTNYQGDLVETQAPILSETNPAFGLTTRYALNQNFKIRGDLMSGKISGDDRYAIEPSRLRRNFNFESDILEAGIGLEWAPFSFSKDDIGRATRSFISPYIFAGLSFFSATPSTSYNDVSEGSSNPKIAKDRQEGSSVSGIALPVGGGIQFNLNSSFFLTTEVGVRTTNTDFIDGISFSGNPDKNDWYWFGGVGLGLRFARRDIDLDGIADRKDGCPEQKGSVENMGCPDRDSDGIVDKNDSCPDQYGLANLDGCPDQDADGITDAVDKCPKTFGIAIAEGCPDADTDAIPDKKDECPYLAGTLAGKGCPLLDTNANGSIKDELKALKRPGLLDAVHKHQKNYWWLKSPEVWGTLSW